MPGLRRAFQLARPLWLVLPLLIGPAACAPLGGGTITRTVGGQSREGIFVSPYSYEHFLRAELAQAQGDLQLARQHYRRARAGPEDDPLLIARLADVTDRLDREDEALELLAEGEALDPDSELIWLTRGAIHERHGRAEEAIEAYARAASSAPRSESGPLALSRLLRSRGEVAQADAVLERYLERGQGAGAARARLRLAVQRRDATGAAEAVRSLLETAPARSDEVRAAAETALEGGRPEIALRLVAALPDEPEHRPLRLRAALAAGDRGRAEAILARWMPSGPTELVRVAEGYLAIDMPERAAELARVALRSDAGAPARLTLGRALRAMGRPAEAAERLASIEPGSQGWPDGPVELARALEDAGRPALAAEVLAVARSQRDAVPLRLAQAEAHALAGDDALALALLAATGGHGALELTVARAELLDRLGNVDQAAQAFRSLPIDDARLSPRTRARARAESRLTDDPEEAISTLRAWTERAPEDVLSQARLAELLHSTGASAEAREVAGAALRFVTLPSARRRLVAVLRPTS